MWELWRISVGTCYDADLGEVYDEHILIYAGTFEECIQEWEYRGLDPFYVYLVNTETGGIVTFDYVPW